MKSFLTLWTILYLLFAVLFHAALASAMEDLLGHVWLASALVILGTPSCDLAMLVTFVFLTLWHQPRSLVHLRLDAHELAQLQAAPPQTAVIIPAHCEASSTDDRDAFIERLMAILQQTPDWSAIWLLFDSPHKEQANEQKLVEGVRERLRSEGLRDWQPRLRFAEYRDKPSHLKNKPGSVLLFLQDHPELEYVLLLDADSTLGSEESRPEALRILERSVWTLQRNPDIAFIQGGLEIQDYESLWGWLQCQGTIFGTSYTSRIYEGLFAETSPCYGHGAVFVAHRLRDVSCPGYLSHDHIEAAELARVGWKCIYTRRIVSFETAEESFLGYSLRSLRWCRGNVQWLHYLAMHWRELPLGAAMFLWFGILNFLYPLAATLFLATSAALMSRDVALFNSHENSAVAALMLLSGLGLIGPKLLLIRWDRLIGMLLIGLLVAPAQMCLEGLMFLIAPFDSKWLIRKARTTEMNLDHIQGIFHWCLPGALLSVLLLWLVVERQPRGIGETCLLMSITLFVASPASAILVSLPVFRRSLVPTGVHANSESIASTSESSNGFPRPHFMTSALRGRKNLKASGNQ